MSPIRIDPGECPICGAPHCSCGGGPIEVVLLPARDAAAAAARAASGQRPPLVADQVQTTLPAGSFTTATYRGAPTKKK